MRRSTRDEAHDSSFSGEKMRHYSSGLKATSRHLSIGSQTILVTIPSRAKAENRNSSDSSHSQVLSQFALVRYTACSTFQAQYAATAEIGKAMERVVTRVPALTHDLIRSHATAGTSEWQTLQIIDNLNARSVSAHCSRLVSDWRDFKRRKACS